MKQQLVLGDDETLNEALKQTFELGVVKLAVESSIRLRNTSDRTPWRSRPPPKLQKKLPATCMPVLKERRPLSEVPSTQTGRRNGFTPIGYWRRAALRREQYDMVTEEDSHCLVTVR
jgi:hypothetical protein